LSASVEIVHRGCPTHSVRTAASVSGADVQLASLANAHLKPARRAICGRGAAAPASAVADPRGKQMVLAYAAGSTGSAPGA
jgi:hypothetical protein